MPTKPKTKKKNQPSSKPPTAASISPVETEEEKMRRLVANIQKSVKTTLQATATATHTAPSYTLALEGVKADYVMVDDKRTPGDITDGSLPANMVWCVCKSYSEFEDYLKKHGVPGYVSFDYNLDHPKSGYDCCKLYVEYCCKEGKEELPSYNYHGGLESGRRAIEGYLSVYNKLKREYRKKSKLPTNEPART